MEWIIAPLASLPERLMQTGCAEQSCVLYCSCQNGQTINLCQCNRGLVVR